MNVHYFVYCTTNGMNCTWDYRVYHQTRSEWVCTANHEFYLDWGGEKNTKFTYYTNNAVCTA